jgi:hypothetical protein
MRTFGFLGAIDHQRSHVRRDVQHAAARVNDVRRALCECSPENLKGETLARLVEALQEAEQKRDGLT